MSRSASPEKVWCHRYLGGAAGRVLLVGLALYALVRMGKKLTGRDKAAAARSGASWPAMDDADLTTRFRLKHPEGNTPDTPVQVSSHACKCSA